MSSPPPANRRKGVSAVEYIIFCIPPGIGAIALGLFVFFDAGAGIRAYEEKMRLINARKVKPELLTAVDKRRISKPKGGIRCYVTLRGSNQPPFEISIEEECYNLVQVGKDSVAYRFPDGYMIPQFDIAAGRLATPWIFLVGGLVVGGLFLGGPFIPRKRSKR